MILWPPSGQVLSYYLGQDSWTTDFSTEKLMPLLPRPRESRADTLWTRGAVPTVALGCSLSDCTELAQWVLGAGCPGLASFEAKSLAQLQSPREGQESESAAADPPRKPCCPALSPSRPQGKPGFAGEGVGPVLHRS